MHGLGKVLSNRSIRVFALFWLWAFCLHALQVLRYSNALPLADQWDSEGLLLLKPWLEGQLAVGQLFALHNEHRIFFTRVFDLLVFWLNSGHWDNRAFALANAVVYATFVGLLAQVAFFIRQPRLRAMMLLFVALLPATAVNNENTLWGFQSQFYFCLVFLVVILRVCARAEFSGRAAALALVMAICSFGTIASGFLVDPVAALLLLLGIRNDPGAGMRRGLTAAALLVLTVFGYAIVPNLAYHAMLRAQSFPELVLSTTRLLAWPLAWPLAWLPLVAWFVPSLLRSRRMSATDAFFFGLAGWTVLQVVALAFGRGHDLILVASRYTEILLPGVLANLYFAGLAYSRLAQLKNPRLRRIAKSTAMLLGAVCGGYFVIAMLNGVLEANVSRSDWQTSVMTTDALLRGDPIDAPRFALAYPRIDRFLMLLRDPTLRRLLHADQSGLTPPCEVRPLGLLSQMICAASPWIPQPGPAALVRMAEVGSTGLVAHCHLDEFIGGGEGDTLQGAGLVRFRGWILSPRPGYLSSFNEPKLLLLGAQSNYVLGGTPYPRVDVADALGSSRYAWSGLDVTANTAGLAVGDYEIALQNADSALCHSGRLIHRR